MCLDVTAISADVSRFLDFGWTRHDFPISEKSRLAMSSLRLQKRLAAGVMKCGKNKVRNLVILSLPFHLLLPRLFLLQLFLNKFILLCTILVLCICSFSAPSSSPASFFFLFCIFPRLTPAPGVVGP